MEYLVRILLRSNSDPPPHPPSLLVIKIDFVDCFTCPQKKNIALTPNSLSEYFLTDRMRHRAEIAETGLPLLPPNLINFTYVYITGKVKLAFSAAIIDPSRTVLLALKHSHSVFVLFLSDGSFSELKLHSFQATKLENTFGDLSGPLFRSYDRPPKVGGTDIDLPLLYRLPFTCRLGSILFVSPQILQKD